MQPRNLLTPREVEVSTLVWEGLTNRDIARTLGTTEQVVKNYLRTTFDKLGVWSRLELALYVAGHGGAQWKNAVEMREEVSPVVELNGVMRETGKPSEPPQIQRTATTREGKQVWLIAAGGRRL